MYYIVIFKTTSVREVMGRLHTLVIQGKVFYLVSKMTLTEYFQGNIKYCSVRSRISS